VTGLIIAEAGAIFGALSAMIFLSSQPAGGDWPALGVVLAQALVLAAGCVAAFYFGDLYDLRVVRSTAEFAPRLVRAVGIMFLLSTGLFALLPAIRISEEPVVSSLIFTVGLLLPMRAVSYNLMRSRPFAERVLIVGTSPLARTLVEEMTGQPQFRYRIVGIADDATGESALAPGIPVFGPLPHLAKIVEEVRPDRIVVTLAERRGRLPVRQLLECRRDGVVIEDGVQMYERLTGKLAIEALTPSTIVFSEAFRKRRVQEVLLRALSIVSASLGLLVCAVPMLVIAVAIKLDSPGPVLFRHPRAGRGGRRFELLKFRTMRPASGVTSEWARDNEGRITRIGKWLRRFRLDELPQFVNVLRGDMNLVGPRPHPVSNFEMFAAHIPYYLLRSTVRPGVTGWAQVRYGYANDLDEETEKMRYDLFYIKHMSFGLDLRILAETAKLVMWGRRSQ
jgi:exopolysaccharide biosynthesis polyprenyl glycosylphosphotransferase